MLVVGLDGSTILRVSVLKRPREEALISTLLPTPPALFANDNSVNDEGMVDDCAMDMVVKNHQNIKEEEEDCGGGGEEQSNHSFYDGINFHVEQTFPN